MIELEPHDHGVVLPVRAHAGARRNQISGDQNGMLKVSVTQAPERGKANKAITTLLAKQLSLRKSQIELLSGDTSPQKRFLISGISGKDLLSRIASLTEGD